MDSAFKTAAFPGCTTDELRELLANGTASNPTAIATEIQRREKAAAGDTSVMTDGERLRFLRTGKAR